MNFPGARPDIDPAATWLRRSCAPTSTLVIFGVDVAPIKLISKQRSELLRAKKLKGTTSTANITRAERGSQTHRSQIDARPMPGRASGELIITRHQSFWGAHNHSASSMDRDFGALGDLLEALLVASRCARDLQSLRIRCRKLFLNGFSSILSSPHLSLSSENEIFSS